jgi:hypothetical protein
MPTQSKARPDLAEGNPREAGRRKATQGIPAKECTRSKGEEPKDETQGKQAQKIIANSELNKFQIADS